MWPVKDDADGGGGNWLVRMEWRPAGWSVCLPLLIFPCTMKSRSSFLAPAHPGGSGKRAVKGLCGVVVSVCLICLSVCLSVHCISQEPHVNRRQCNTLCTSGFVDDVIFSHNGANTDIGHWRIIRRDSPGGEVCSRRLRCCAVCETTVCVCCRATVCITRRSKRQNC